MTTMIDPTLPGGTKRRRPWVLTISLAVLLLAAVVAGAFVIVQQRKDLDSKQRALPTARAELSSTQAKLDSDLGRDLRRRRHLLQVPAPQPHRIAEPRIPSTHPSNPFEDRRTYLSATNPLVARTARVLRLQPPSVTRTGAAGREMPGAGRRPTRDGPCTPRPRGGAGRRRSSRAPKRAPLTRPRWDTHHASRLVKRYRS